MSPLAIPPVLCGLAPLEPEAPAAAASPTPASADHPASFRRLLQMRTSARNPQSLSARRLDAGARNPKVSAVSASPASSRRQVRPC